MASRWTGAEPQLIEDVERWIAGFYPPRGYTQEKRARGAAGTPFDRRVQVRRAMEDAGWWRLEIRRSHEGNRFALSPGHTWEEVRALLRAVGVAWRAGDHRRPLGSVLREMLGLTEARARLAGQPER